MNVQVTHESLNGETLAGFVRDLAKKESRQRWLSCWTITELQGHERKGSSICMRVGSPCDAWRADCVDDKLAADPLGTPSLTRALACSQKPLRVIISSIIFHGT